ncbi:MAG: efflux RND transporter periplasmic adaptor subunit [Polymorphobacter sp.]|uniref:efflux RND transporter periplasmic adaptor subunit n=1 Tax=Polymorphobacter sp. TaxID=1909290 RepID=UPI003A83D9DB
MKRSLPLLLLLAACNSAPDAPADTPARQVDATTAAATPASEVTLATVPGTIVQPPGARVAVTATLGGTAAQVLVQPGEAVRKGQLLATLLSPEALALASDRARAEAARGVTRAEAARMALLESEGIVAGARADAARAADAAAAIDAREASRLLARASADDGGTIRLTAPIAGRIAAMAIEAGAAISAMSAPFIIEAVGSRSLALQVPERLAGQLAPGMAVLTADGRRGRLETIASTIDPATRSLAARARLDDDGSLLTSGRLIEVSLRAPAPEGALAVPRAALLQTAGETIVYVKTPDGFKPRPVAVLGQGDPAIITSGLAAGDEVATSNLPELRAAVAR